MGIDEVLAGREKWTVVHGDVREVLKTLPAAAFDFCLSDVPYGLGAREPTSAEIIAYLQGEELDTRGDFMGRRWSIPSVGVWLEVSRCLKPGAHVFSFGGTRTWDLISLGLRAAGFENRDTIAEDYPALRWDYGSGFPKALDVSKAIDSAAGAEREVVGSGRWSGREGEPSSTDDWGLRNEKPRTETSPATEAAAEWDGWKTALKPSWEPVLVFRKPLEGAVAANVLKHGCGALNIDACRVYTDWNEADRPESWKRSGNSRDGYDAETIAVPPGNGIYCNPLGRFPPNRVLIHAEGCVRVGGRRVRGVQVTAGGLGGYGRDESMPYQIGVGRQYAEDETVDDWRCVDGCPVKMLGEQSGESVSTGGTGTASKQTDGRIGWRPSNTGGLGDTGTASRFYPQFQAQEPWFYSSKASRAEREFGCEHLPARKSADVTGRDEEAAGHNNPRSGSRKRGEIRNTGPCVKPQEFLRWLVRLGCRPGGLVLVPYCGTGSEIIACVGAGMRAIGIEGDAEMVAIANARCAAWEQYPAGAKPAAGIERERLEARGQLSLLDMAG